MAEPRTLIDFFGGDWRGVLVPILQRDFAQGRPDEVEVRTRFLRALREALERVHAASGNPLDLDFVYGYREPDAPYFIPIDGQQRLTTLFLLHWYLAIRDRESAHFRAWSKPDEADAARFRYEVRSSAEDFFNGLVEAELALEALLSVDEGAIDALSKTIEDQHWYYLSWKLDPTVSACLVMLDAIHAEFSDAPSGLYRRLVDSRNPAITFQFLDLQDFGLGDDLYIKMNARGRKLTDFEVFKSELEGYVRSHEELAGETAGPDALPLHEYLGSCLDSKWLQWLWGLLHRENLDSVDRAWTRQIDPQMLNLLRGIAIATYPTGEATAEAARRIDRALEDLHNGVVTSFPAYEALGAVTPDFVRALVALFDRWIGPAGGTRTWLGPETYYKEWETIRRLREDRPRARGERTKPRASVTYEELVCFAAWCLSLRSGDEPQADLHDWMRVVCNLARATAIDGGESLRRALGSLRRLHAAGPILENLAHGGSVEFFLGQQVREERLKAQLILRNEGAWRPLIEEAETHPYFRGQIEFVFAFCGLLERWLPGGHCDWGDDDDASFRAAFSETWVRVLKLFPRSDKGEYKGPGKHRWERALLCRGDYLLRKGSNSSLLNDQDSRVSWKRFLRADRDDDWRIEKRRYFGEVLAHLDPTSGETVEKSLDDFIAAGIQDNGDGTHGWREILVSHPEMLQFCGKRWLRFDSRSRIFLLAGVRRATHMGLRTWDLALTMKSPVEQGDFAPFDRIDAPPVWGVCEEPYALLTASGQPTLNLVVTQRNGMFWVASEVDRLGPDDAWKEACTATPARFAEWLKEHLARMQTQVEDLHR